MWTRKNNKSFWPNGNLAVIGFAIALALLVSVMAAARFQQVRLAEAMLKEAAMQSMRVKFQTIDAFDRYYSKVIVPRVTAAGAQFTHDFQNIGSIATTLSLSGQTEVHSINSKLKH